MTKACIIEAGLIKNGLPLIQRRYLSPEDYRTDPFLIGGFFSAIQTFTDETFKDFPKKFIMEKYITHLENLKCEDDSFLIYAIAKSDVESKKINEALSKVGTALDRWKSLLVSTNIDISKYSEINPIFDEIFAPLNQELMDAAKMKLMKF